MVLVGAMLGKIAGVFFGKKSDLNRNKKNSPAISSKRIIM